MNGNKAVRKYEQAHPSDGREREDRIIGGWHWLEQRLIHRELMQREKQEREEESAQLSFLSALGIAA